MKLIWALVACACLAQAQTAVWIDLAGPWMLDGKQEFRLPQGVRVPVPLPRGIHELTRVVRLPEAARGVPLALTIGTLAEWYEVRIDGERVGSFGSQDIRKMPIARPHTFDLAPIDRAQIVITIRAETPQFSGSGGWVLGDFGPYLLTSPEAAPRNAGAFAIGQRKLLRINDLTQALILACLALVVWLIFLNDRRKALLLWLGLLLTLVVVVRLWLFASIDASSAPFRYALWFDALRYWVVLALLAHFATAALDVPRWVPWTVWLAAAVAAAVTPNADDRAVWNWLSLAAMLTLLVGIAIGYLRHVPRRPWLAATLALAVYAQVASFRGVPQMIGLPLLNEMYLFGIRFTPFLLLLTLFSLAMTIQLVRELLRDRDEKQRLARDLESARTVQRILLPSTRTDSASLETDSVYEPAQEVGGDFYLIEPSGNGLLAVVGDVSGKGLKAAMLVSLIVGALRSRRSDHPGVILADLNRAVHGKMDGGFATCVAVHVDSSGEARAASAGHLAPYLSGHELAVPQGLPLGLMADIDYDECEFQLTGQLTLLSDGVVEAANPAGELFGFERTRELSGKTAAAIADAARAWGQNDDITAVTVRRAAA